MTAAACTPVPACVHWYVLEPNDRPVSRGRCRHCGHERDFKNGLTLGSDVGHSWRHYLQAESPALLMAMRYEARALEGWLPFEGVA